ncbi:MAG: hypothetical protein QW303_08140, partial [Nitrososphaerota archaeon]
MKVITKVAPRNPSLQRYFNQKFRQHFRRYIKAKEKKVKWAIDAYLTLMYGLTSYVILKSFEPREDSDRIADIFIDELFAHVLVHNKPVISSYIASIANNSLQLISEKALGELLRALRRHTSDIRRDHELTLSSFIESNLHEKIIKEHIRILRKYTGVDYSHLF